MPNKFLAIYGLMSNHCNVILKIDFVWYKRKFVVNYSTTQPFYVMATVADIFKSRQRKKDVTVWILPCRKMGEYSTHS